jgi:hypothetical protein
MAPASSALLTDASSTLRMRCGKTGTLGALGGLRPPELLVEIDVLVQLDLPVRPRLDARRAAADTYSS